MMRKGKSKKPKDVDKCVKCFHRGYCYVRPIGGILCGAVSRFHLKDGRKIPGRLYHWDEQEIKIMMEDGKSLTIDRSELEYVRGLCIGF
jgi:hypothetical protein